MIRVVVMFVIVKVLCGFWVMMVLICLFLLVNVVFLVLGIGM